MLFDGCLVKIEVPHCFYVQEVEEDRVYLAKNPYFSSCPLAQPRYELVRSESEKVEVYINGQLWREFKGCVKK